MKIEMEDMHEVTGRIESNQRKDGSCPVCLRVTKNGKRKYIDLGLAANDKEWNEELARYKKDKRLNPNYENYNALLTHYEERKDKLLRKFAEIGLIGR